MNTVRTVSDTKRAFYTNHTRPINSIYRRVVEELMVEMHLLSVNVDFEYDPIYALGVVSSFDQFMEGYSPEGEKASIFAALCQALESDVNVYRAEAQQAQEQIKDWSGEAVVALVCDPHQGDGADALRGRLKAIADNPKFKYSRLFAIGLYTLVSTVDSERLQTEESRNQTLEKIAQGLGLSLEKLQKDIELYRSNLEKVKQAQAVMKDILEAGRKKRQERALQKEEERE
ncbi:photosystem II biogenesis protein Psp29 [Roseofilum reptotaenium CS-1145]|uniref:Protein Thf1 n=1 Tax=Roseofilum reptotaenium AO1-A TaxID=1925591 RepID=A0A1L9QVB6_9CYAN|nr:MULTISPECIES: photosystem II biogenesis protein Psp29 [Roseofilum]MBP0027449.1 photosystem II biogenesis protein Psp29 [Roseofilum sp. Guam]MDB9520319.1 photosystem II biogenesis protein Psp29 [Roseofilum reptotaenium CS-1145]OJJ26645.1 photosystem II biogenesis protein Psp29 [Roseofilum reptotaenium AO1-A]